MADIHCRCEERFEGVRAALARNLDSGEELGASLVLDIDGDIAIDMWGGFCDEARQQDTLVRHVMSVPPPPLSFDLAALDPTSPAVRTLTGPFVEAGVANTPGWRRADIGAANGHGNARSVARVMSVIARGGEVDGVRLLSQDTIDLIFREQQNGIDLVLGVPLRLGIGYGLPRPDVLPWASDEKICFWGGWGGSVIAMDTGRRMTVSYMMNKMGAGIIGSDRCNEYGQAIYDAITG
jgi:CubicO group peptidase (beta-lactamase class C family)